MDLAVIDLRIVMDATESDIGVRDSDVLELAELSAVGGIPNSTSSGHAAVALLLELPDGRQVLAQTTLALLGNAMRALQARYPDSRP